MNSWPHPLRLQLPRARGHHRVFDAELGLILDHEKVVQRGRAVRGRLDRTAREIAQAQVAEHGFGFSGGIERQVCVQCRLQSRILDAGVHARTHTIVSGRAISSVRASTGLRRAVLGTLQRRAAYSK
jgi:hypothetical protein